MRVLVLADSGQPLTDDQLAVDHDVGLLAVVPALRVLVAVALDAEVAVDDHELDVARARLELVVDRARLVLGHVHVDVEIGVVLLLQLLVQVVGDPLVVPALHGQEFARVVVAQAVVIRDFDSSSARRQDLREQGFGVQVGCLDEDGFLRMPQRRHPCLVLRRVQRLLGRGPPWLATHHRDGKRFVARDRNQRSHGVTWLNLGGIALGVGLDGGVEQSRNGIDARLAWSWVQCCDGTQDFRFEILVVMGILRGMLR